MKESEKIQKLQDLHFPVWMKERRIVSDNLSDRQTMFCICGKLATGLHESTCKKFIKWVNTETVRKLSHLIS